MRGNICGQLFVTDFHDVQFYPLKSKSFAHEAVSEYFIENGVPEQIHSDNAEEMTTKKEWRKTMRDEGGIKATTTSRTRRSRIELSARFGSCSHMPFRGHLEEALNVVAYLDKIKYSKLVMRAVPQGYLDNAKLEKRFNKNAEWFEFYGDVNEEVPSDAPVPLGRAVEINAWVDADHAGDRLTRRSHTGILIFLMSAPIFWYSKRQATIESSTFGSEIVALRTCLEFIKDLRYKLRMMGVPIEGPAVVWCDNKSVANGAAVPEAKLSKKHLGICYHAVREASAAGIWMVGFTHGKHNIADMLTKILSGFKKEGQAGKWMYGR